MSDSTSWQASQMYISSQNHISIHNYRINLLTNPISLYYALFCVYQASLTTNNLAKTLIKFISLYCNANTSMGYCVFHINRTSRYFGIMNIKTMALNTFEQCPSIISRYV
uniref:Uncharacterized protein n=1 Tax=Cacopsylla melanoneura TaxID=428564 RepID=A0A8D8ZAA1_9HEMI